MIIYISIFSALALYAITNYWKPGRIGLLNILIGLLLTVFIGYRFEVGVDWATYELIFADISRMSLSESLSYGDPGYSFINWIVSRMGGQVWHVNLICAAIFSYGLIRFCSVLPQPGLALAVLVPILIVATAMGYTRQATAVGCIMLTFTYFRSTINWRWITWLSLAILFHRSAIFVLPIFAIAGSKRPILTLAICGGIAAVLLVNIVLQNIGDVLSLYFEGDIESSGALARIALGAIVGLSFYLVKDKDILGERHGLVRNMAFAMIILLPMYFVIPSTTFVDRIGVLLLPSQGAILASVAASFRKNPMIEGAITKFILGIYGAILLVWLSFATFSLYWIPYQNVYFVRYL